MAAPMPREPPVTSTERRVGEEEVVMAPILPLMDPRGRVAG